MAIAVLNAENKVVGFRFSEAEAAERPHRFVLAPPEYRVGDGSDYWLRDFMNPAPWLSAGGPPKKVWPFGFQEIFGPEPTMDPGETNRDWTVERTEYATSLRTFVRPGWPLAAGGEFPADAVTGRVYTQAEMDQATVFFKQFGFGRPHFFIQKDARYEEIWMARFPEMHAKYKPAFGINGLDVTAAGAIEQTDVVIAQAQAKIRAAGIKLEHDLIGILLDIRDEDEEEAPAG